MPRVPEWMRDNFRRGLAFHEAGESGDVVPQTVREARQAVEDGDLPDNKPKRMAAWFARHMVDLDTAPQRGDKDFPSPGQVAHLLWGGGVTKSASERAMRWAERTAERLERESNMSDLGNKGRKDDEEEYSEDVIIIDIQPGDDEETIREKIARARAAMPDDEEDEGVDDEMVVNDFEGPSRAVIVIATEGEETSDGRMADVGSLSWRTPPLSLTVNHEPNQRAGRIDSIKRLDSLDGVTVDTFDSIPDSGGPIIAGLVTFNLNTEFGRQVAHETHNGFLTGVSMEVGNEVIEVDDNDVMHLVEGRIGAVTLAPFQAIESAKVVQVASINVWQGPADVDEANYLALIASSIPDTPPSGWFEDPALEGPTPVFVSDEGYVFGHLALWDTCHTGHANVCVTPPRSTQNYAWFRTGYVTTEEGTDVPVGSITMATGHASTRPGVTPAAAIAHYEHTGFAVADVACGEDEYGVWIAGALRPGVTASQVRELRGASLSGDWRSLGGNLELVAALAVNVPGFPVPRLQTGVTASGAQTSLVAAGTVESCGCGDDTSDFEARLAKLETISQILGFTSQATEILSARITK